MKRLRSLIPAALFGNMPLVLAHCPLCTVGVAAAAGGAAYLGVDHAVIAFFVGAFAVSTGWWASNWIKKEYIRHQRLWLVLLSFLLTVIPILPLLPQVYPLYVSLIGDYGSLLNRTYVFNLSLATSVLGGIVVFITPWISGKITAWRQGKRVPFQGVMVTFLLLMVLGTLVQVLM